MARELEITHLRSFLTAVRAGSISRAAAALGNTQPALSQQLRKLERAVGRPLLNRSPSGVTPTRAGEELLPYAERILSLSAQALTEAGRALAGHCGVGLLEDLAASHLPLALADLARLHPGVTLQAVAYCGSSPGLAFNSPIAAARSPARTVGLSSLSRGDAGEGPACGARRALGAGGGQRRCGSPVTSPVTEVER
jgi:molybdenum-dependent DNA-binding transcriptional regulator ModE